LTELKHVHTVVMDDGEEGATTTDMDTEEITGTHTVMQMVTIVMEGTGTTIGTMEVMEDMEGITTTTDIMVVME